MGRDLVAEIQNLPREQRARIEARAQEMEAQIRGHEDTRSEGRDGQHEDEDPSDAEPGKPEDATDDAPPRRTG